MYHETIRNAGKCKNEQNLLYIAGHNINITFSNSYTLSLFFLLISFTKMLVKSKKYPYDSNVFPKLIEKKEWNRRTKVECILKRDIF